MRDVKNGGPAFPVVADAEMQNKAWGGMSLRDYFAAKALAAMIGQPNKHQENCGKKAVPTLAKFAYEYADAMLEAREA